MFKTYNLLEEYLKNSNHNLLYYFILNNSNYYPLIIIENNNSFRIDNKAKEFSDLEKLFLYYQNKIILSLNNYNAKTNIELYKYNENMNDRLINLNNNLDCIKFDLLKRTKNNLLLTSQEITILETYGINYERYGSLNDLLYELDLILNEDDIEELEDLFNKLKERSYYENTNK
ncbi:MAG TPA: hypothetical protein OIM63_06005 [Bacilli bacterium]|nr:hypothetical protein [Bacilli bacterium]